MSITVILFIIGAVVANIAIGFAWYLPQTFGSMWMKDIGCDPAKMGEDKKGMMRGIIVSIICSIIIATVLWYVNYLLGFADVRYFLAGITLMWTAFVVCLRLTHSMFEGRGIRYNLITSGHDLVSLLVMGAIVYYAV